MTLLSSCGVPFPFEALNTSPNSSSVYCIPCFSWLLKCFDCVICLDNVAVLHLYLEVWNLSSFSRCVCVEVSILLTCGSQGSLPRSPGFILLVPKLNILMFIFAFGGYRAGDKSFVIVFYIQSSYSFWNMIFLNYTKICKFLRFSLSSTYIWTVNRFNHV